MVEHIADKVRSGGRVSADEALALYRHAPTSLLGRLADGIRARRHPDGLVTYIIDRNVNYTNVCVAKCNFCAFYRDVGSPDGYVLGFEELFRKIDETIAVGGVQVLMQGGHNPDLPLSWYEDLFRAIKTRYPEFKLHALSPPEVIHISRLSQLPVPAVIDRLIAAGLDSIPGGGAEILVDRVRKALHCYGKATADEWLDVMRHAHRAGLRTTATMMYGTVETDEERLEHLLRLRAMQDETGGFTAFITWSYQRLPPHARDRTHRPRQLRQPAGVLGDAGRQGRAVEPGLWRQRHGQRDDRRERGPCRRRGVLHGRSRDRAQHRGRRLQREAPQHALRHPRWPDLPRTRGPTYARTRHRARGRRPCHDAGRAPLLSSAEPDRQA
jgi:cyclic dehypoxanthinyl futalosine synthase